MCRSVPESAGMCRVHAPGKNEPRAISAVAPDCYRTRFSYNFPFPSRRRVVRRGDIGMDRLRRCVVAGGFTFTTGHANRKVRRRARRAAAATRMVDFNLINSLGNLDDEVDSAVATALGDAADDLTKLISGDEVQDFTPGAIIKGKVSRQRRRRLHRRAGPQERRHPRAQRVRRPGQRQGRRRSPASSSKTSKATPVW